MTTGQRDPAKLEELGRLLRAAREAAGLSQRALADQIDGGKSWLQQMEAGRRPSGEPVAPRAHNLLNLIRQLNAPLIRLGLDEHVIGEEYALRLAGFADTSRYIDRPRSRPTTSERELATKFAMLDEAERRPLEELVEAILRAKGYLPSKGEQEAAADDVADGTSSSGARVSDEGFETKSHPPLTTSGVIATGADPVLGQGPAEDGSHEDALDTVRRGRGKRPK